MTECEKTEAPVKEVSGIVEYTNTDIYKIGAMMAHGATLDLGKIDRSDPRHVRLTVCGPATLIREIDEAWTNPGNLLKKYSIVIKDLKSIVHA